MPLPDLPTLPGPPAPGQSTTSSTSIPSEPARTTSKPEERTFHSFSSGNWTAPYGTGTKPQYRPPQAPRSSNAVASPHSPSTPRGSHKSSISSVNAPPYPTGQGRFSSDDLPNTTGSSYGFPTTPVNHGSAPSKYTGTIRPYQPSSFGKSQYGNVTGIYGSATGSRYASGITLGTGFTANATQASTVWGRQPACTASWSSRLAANNGTVMTTKVYSRTVSLPTAFTSTWAVGQYITGPTTETINVGKSIFPNVIKLFSCGRLLMLFLGKLGPLFNSRVLPSGVA